MAEDSYYGHQSRLKRHARHMKQDLFLLAFMTLPEQANSKPKKSENLERLQLYVATAKQVRRLKEKENRDENSDIGVSENNNEESDNHTERR